MGLPFFDLTQIEFLYRIYVILIIIRGKIKL